jgi:hypothetical protein
MPGDTTLHLDIVYRALDPDNLTVGFTYPTAIDTAGAAAEWAAILYLNDRSFTAGKYVPVLDLRPHIFPAERRIVLQGRFSTTTNVAYTLPVSREGEDWRSSYNVLEGYSTLKNVLQADSSGELPANMGISHPSSYFCLASAQGNSKE